MSLLPLPAEQLPGEALERVFKATLDLLVAYKDQVAEAEKEGEAEDDDDMDGLDTDEEDNDGSDKEMGDDVEDGDQADSVRLQKLAEQALANGVVQYAEQRRIDIEKEKLEKASAAATS